MMKGLPITFILSPFATLTIGKSYLIGHIEVKYFGRLRQKGSDKPSEICIFRIQSYVSRATVEENIKSYSSILKDDAGVELRVVGPVNLNP